MDVSIVGGGEGGDSWRSGGLPGRVGILERKK